MEMPKLKKNPKEFSEDEVNKRLNEAYYIMFQTKVSKHDYEVCRKRLNELVANGVQHDDLNMLVPLMNNYAKHWSKNEDL
jgi:hypothetical protein